MNTTGTATDFANLLDLLNTWLVGTVGWASKRAVAGSEMIWQAPGGGTDAIIVGAKVFSSVPGDFYNWRLGGFTAYDPALAFTAQAGYVGAPGGVLTPSPVLNLINTSIPYRFYANGNRVIVLAKVSSVYVCAYLGFLASYMAPGSFPYPLVVGGSQAFSSEPTANDAQWRWSNASSNTANFPIPLSGGGSFDKQSSLRLRLSTGIWRGFNLDQYGTIAGRTFPHSAIQGAVDWRTNLDGSYTLMPVVLADATPPNVYGELDGIYAVTGFGNAAENIITIGGVNYYVVQNVGRTDQASYFAIKEA